MSSPPENASGLEGSSLPAPSADARASSRNRAALWTTASALVVRLVSSLSTLLSVPLLVGYFGQERYGVFAAILSMGPLLMLVDLGMGLGLTTAVARAVGEGDDGRLRRLIVSASSWSLVLCLLALGIGALVAPRIDWTSTFNAATAFDPATVLGLVLVIGAAFVFQAWGNLGNAIVRGLQLGHLANGALALSTVGSLGATALAIHFDASPVMVAAAFLLPTTLAPALLWGLVGVRDARVRPVGRVALDEVMPLARVGLGYFVLQVAAVALSQFDLLILARARGGLEVTPYAVALRFTGAGTAFLSAYLASLWPAYAEAAARGDWEWVRRTHRRSRLAVTGLAAVGGVGFVVLGPLFVTRLAGPEAVAPLAMYVLLALTMIARAWTDAHAFLLNGLGQVRIQVVAGVVHAAVTPALAVLLADRFGSVGIAAAGTLGFVLVSGWAIPRAAHRVLSRS